MKPQQQQEVINNTFYVQCVNREDFTKFYFNWCIRIIEFIFRTQSAQKLPIYDNFNMTKILEWMVIRNNDIDVIPTWYDILAQYSYQPYDILR
jgi:hypothetical protein